MQAIILAAGMGKRMGELTRDNTKCMVKVNGFTLIERMLRQLDKFHLNKIVIVIGYKGDNLKKFISTLNINTPVEYVVNPIYDKTNNIYSLRLARDFLFIDDTILLESDLIFEDNVITKLLNADYPNLALVAKYENWMDGSAVTVDSEDNIKRFILPAEFLFAEIPFYYKTVNIYKFSKTFSATHYVPFLEAYSTALGNNEYYEQVLRLFTLMEKPGIKVLKLDAEKWYEIDDIQDLDIAESVFATQDKKLDKIKKRYGGYWRYPKMLDFCYLINPYFPDQKFKDEIKANFDALISKYPSGQSVNSLLAGKMFGVDIPQIVVGNGASELITALAGGLEGKVGVILPTFEEYPNRIGNRAEFFYPRDADFNYGIDEVKKYFKGIPNLILINPDNPSGNYINRADMTELLTWCKQNGKKIIIDESFVDFSYEGSTASLIRKDILSTFPNLIVMKSISKSYGVPGCRLGVLASGDVELIKYLKKRVSIWNINSFGEFFLQIIGKYEKQYQQGCQSLREERERFYGQLDKITFLKVLSSQANYFLCEAINGIFAKQLTEALLDNYNIFIKDCSEKPGFNSAQYVRFAIRNKSDNDILVKSLKSLTYR
ncbi:MAG: aminotransferase class I/II-fold pyridoxal phosphate-dependent enzyme [Candidatus Omnitrophota bacterium]|jgi:histidinol-phosphate/aromatic aminotransferase/cobyric acid decarboxylase-like protein/choline kinase